MKTIEHQSAPLEVNSAPMPEIPAETLPARANFNTGVDRYDRAEIVSAIKQTVCRGASDAQLRMFLEVCKSTGLDPFLKEIWFVSGVGIMAGRDGYLRVANQHPAFDGMETVVERDPKTNVPIKAVCKVWRKDRNHPVQCEAYYSEYTKPAPVWKQYPSAMISKVAEVMALKRSFSINGVVTEEEIGPRRVEPVGPIARVEQEVPQPDYSFGTETPVAEAVPAKTEEPLFKTRGEMRKAFTAQRERVGDEVYLAALAHYKTGPDLLWPSAQAAEECYRWLKEQPGRTA